MYHDIVAAHGQLISFGMDFAEKLLSHHSSICVAIPFLLLVVGSVGLQYLQMSRLNARNRRPHRPILKRPCCRNTCRSSSVLFI